MRHWIEPVESPEGDALSREVKVVADDGRVVARGGLEVEWIPTPPGTDPTERTASVRFVGMVVE